MMSVKVNIEPAGMAELRHRIQAVMDRFDPSLEVAVGIPAGLKYDDGTSVGRVARTNEFGATVEHPGGTAYYWGGSGNMDYPEDLRWVANADPMSENMKRTKAHRIQIPERPFLRTAVAFNTRKYIRMFRAGVNEMLRDEATQTTIYTQIGEVAVRDIRHSIRHWNNPPNSRQTEKLKGFNDPLVGTTGTLSRSATFVIREEEG
jgi:hypothetical protein